MNDRIKKINDDSENIQIDGINLYEIFSIIIKRWKLLIGIFFISVIVTTIISLRITPIYRAATTILPISSESTKYGNLTSLFSPTIMPISGRGQTDTNKIIAILTSRTIIENVTKNINHYDILLDEKPEEMDPFNYLVGKIHSMVSISNDLKTGVIIIYADSKYPEIARDIANQYVSELESILKDKSLTVTKMNRVFIEEQLRNEEIKLKDYQKELAEFQKETKMLEMVEPAEQVKSTMDLYAKLINQKITLEVELKKVEAALSEGNPRITALKNQLEAVNSQIKKIEEKTQISSLSAFEDAPDKFFDYSNLLRKIETSQTLYEILLKIYEQIKYEEIRNSLYVEVIDPAITPTGPIKPKKKKMVGVAGVSSLILGGFFILLLEWFRNMIKK